MTVGEEALESVSGDRVLPGVLHSTCSWGVPGAERAPALPKLPEDLQTNKNINKNVFLYILDQEREGTRNLYVTPTQQIAVKYRSAAIFLVPIFVFFL